MSDDETPKKKTGGLSNSNTMFFAGAGVGAYGTTLAVTAGYVCPMCVVAAPALIGWGLYERTQEKKAAAGKNGEDDSSSDI